MDRHTLSSSSPPKTLEERACNIWAEDNAKELLETIANLKKPALDLGTHPGTATHYFAKEGTDNDLRHILALIYRENGPLHMYYKGCDRWARHWASGWETDIEKKPVLRVILHVEMGKRLSSQSPMFDGLASSAPTRAPQSEFEEDGELVESKVESEVPDEDHEVWSGEELTENEQVWSLEESGGKEIGEHQDRADWVKLPISGVDESDWTEPKGITTVVKNAGRFLIEAIQKA